MKAHKKLATRYMTPAAPTGNVFTYGWIFIMNQMLRKVLTTVVMQALAASAVGSMGICLAASVQMLVIALNILLLLFLRPYAEQKIVKAEVVLLIAVLLVCWSASMMTMLADQKSESLQLVLADVGIIKGFGNLCVVLILALVLACIVIPLWFALDVAGKLAKLAKGDDALLNEISYKFQMKHEEEGKRALEQRGFWSTVLTSAALEPHQLNVTMASHFPLIHETLGGISKGLFFNVSPEELRELHWLVELIKANAERVVHTCSGDLQKQETREIKRHLGAAAKTRIGIFVLDSDGFELLVHIKVQTKLSKLFAAYVDSKSPNIPENYYFAMDGIELKKTDTPSSLNIRNGARIDVLRRN